MGMNFNFKNLTNEKIIIIFNILKKILFYLIILLL